MYILQVILKIGQKVDHGAALGNDFTDAMEPISYTPTDGGSMDNELAGVWWLILHQVLPQGLDLLNSRMGLRRMGRY